MFPMIPRIDPEIARLAPGFCALSIVVEAAPVIDTLVGERALARACAALGTDEAPWALEHLAAWDQVFKGFGAKPARTPCSAQALRKRVLRDGVLPAIDPVVDLYNATGVLNVPDDPPYRPRDSQVGAGLLCPQHRGGSRPRD
ncbi:hypothetical protein UW989_15910 [Aeromonas caviae]|uniref:hypothetical protein n=1 Tax=Aeromonas caviae TaxID=648 RepID=UPI002AB33CB1|nr:hypothetical protein [Aeromonas caviae]MDY7785276.1 hypothetical protein [Aeromonas caviae]